MRELPAPLLYPGLHPTSTPTPSTHIRADTKPNRNACTDIRAHPLTDTKPNAM